MKYTKYLTFFKNKRLFSFKKYSCIKFSTYNSSELKNFKEDDKLKQEYGKYKLICFYKINFIYLVIKYIRINL